MTSIYTVRGKLVWYYFINASTEIISCPEKKRCKTSAASGVTTRDT